MAEHESPDETTASTLTAIRRRALTASTYAEWHQVARDIETLADLLAAANERAETAERERDEARSRMGELGEAETEQRIVTPSGLAYEPTLRDLENQDWWLPGVRLEERQVYPTPWRVAADTPGTGLSATETEEGGHD